MKKETRKKIQIVSALLFLLYLVCLTYFLFFAESMGRSFEEREYTYNLHLFKEISRFWQYRRELGMAAVLANIVGNVVCFIPFGAILPVLNRKARNFFMILMLSFQFSLLVECAQLVSRVGSFDVDDLFLNTLGGVIGFVIFTICNRVRRHRYG